MIVRDKVDLDITWVRDKSLEDIENLQAPELIAREIVEDLTAALAEFEAVAAPESTAGSTEESSQQGSKDRQNDCLIRRRSRRSC